MATRLPLLTNSAAKCYRACPRLYSLRYEQCWRPLLDAAALHFGKLFHRGLEAWWLSNALPPDDRLAAALAAVAGEADPFDRARAEALLIGYHYRWIDEPLEVLHVEAEFRAPHVNPDTGAASRTWDEGGKMDAVVRTADGRVWVVEHKTSSEDISQGSAYWRRLRLDSQISTYLRGAASIGFDDVAGCLYDVIGKATLRPYKATPVDARKYTKPTKKDPEPRLYAGQREEDESPDAYRGRLLADIGSSPNDYYQRGEVVRLEADRRGAAMDMWQTGRAIAESRRLRHWPRNPAACVSYGRTCEFFDVCTNAASLNDTSRFRKAEQQHEELTAT